MLEADFFLLFVRPLNRLGIRYIIGGSVATTFYGEPRATNDIDLVVFLKATDVKQFVDAFPSESFYVPPIETILSEMAREQNGQFNIVHIKTGFKGDVYLTGRDELSAWGFRNQRTIAFENEPLVLAPPEYVILKKLVYFREGGSQKHIRDIRSMLSLSHDQIDQSVIRHWIQKLDLIHEWKLVSE